MQWHLDQDQNHCVGPTNLCQFKSFHHESTCIASPFVYSQCRKLSLAWCNGVTPSPLCCPACSVLSACPSYSLGYRNKLRHVFSKRVRQTMGGKKKKKKSLMVAQNRKHCYLDYSGHCYLISSHFKL